MHQIHPDRLIIKARTLDKLIRKHGIRPEEVRELVRRAPLIRAGRGRRIYNIYGTTEAGRYLIAIVRPLGEGWTQLLTARSMSKAEQRDYRQRRRR